MTVINRLSSSAADFDASLSRLLAYESGEDDRIEATVTDVLKRVKTEGDVALLEYTKRFDRINAASVASLELPQSRLQSALAGLASEDRDALTFAAKRIRVYHEKQVQVSWRYTEADGTVLGQQVTPLDRVGLYVPGGKAA